MTNLTLAENPVLLIVRAVDFAARKHVSQRRKGENAEPYINHPIEVAALLAETTQGVDPALIAAGLLHDTLEDTDTTHDELVAHFGADVAGLVAEVTDDKSLPKAERKRLQVLHAPEKSPRAKKLKIADKTVNLKAILKSPPAGWSGERKREYFLWACAVVEGCRGIDHSLEHAFDQAFRRGAASFGIDS